MRYRCREATRRAALAATVFAGELLATARAFAEGLLRLAAGIGTAWQRLPLKKGLGLAVLVGLEGGILEVLVAVLVFCVLTFLAAALCSVAAMAAIYAAYSFWIVVVPGIVLVALARTIGKVRKSTLLAKSSAHRDPSDSNLDSNEREIYANFTG